MGQYCSVFAKIIAVIAGQKIQISMLNHKNVKAIWI